MMLLRTPTPAYERQPGGPPPADKPTGALGWIASLIRTPTPTYKYPAPIGTKARDHADKASKQ